MAPRTTAEARHEVLLELDVDVLSFILQRLCLGSVEQEALFKKSKVFGWTFRLVGGGLIAAGAYTFFTRYQTKQARKKTFTPLPTNKFIEVRKADFIVNSN